jgi:hypothetical protein
MNTETFQIFTTKEHKELKEKFFISAPFAFSAVKSGFIRGQKILTHEN